MRFDLTRGLLVDPVELGCYVSGGSQQSSGSGSSQGQSLTLPSNFANPSFVNAAPGTSQALQEIGGGGWLGTAGNQIDAGQMMSPYQFNNGASTSSNNPLVAPVTGAQQQTLGEIGSLVTGLPSSLSGAFGLLNSEMQPGYAAGLATSPETQAAISSAIQPIRQTFNSQTVPGLQGSFTQAGQRVGQTNGLGSSAFANAFATAQGNELANEASTAGAIANNAYQTGLNVQANAPAQVASLTSSELNDMISGLNAQALPQLTQQYGITAGTQLYQQQMQTILQALGLSVQGEQPSLGYGSESTNSAEQQTSGSGSSFGLSNPFSIGI